MPSLIPRYEYDIFISYRQKDNKHDGWVTEFVNNLKGELESTFKEEVSVYFDINPHDGLLETHDVDASLKDKLKCLVFIPIISRTYCDPKSFAWENEFRAFVEMASHDQFGLKVKLPNGNIAGRVLPVRIHELDNNDIKLCESVLGGVLRGVEFIFKSPGVNRPLLPKEENPQENQNHTSYRDQINKVANAVQEIISGLTAAGSGEELNLKEEESEQKEIEDEEIIIRKKRRNTGIIVGLVLILFVGLLFVFQFLGKKKSSGEQLEKSIAVLPFINDSPEASDENTPFVNGLMEEILINLQTIKEFRVPGRTSVEQYRSVFDKSVSEKAKELGVNYIVEGSVQKYGDKFRLRVQLIRAKGKETHLWAKSYEQEIRSTNDIFNIQSQIAQAIAAELKTVISPEEKLLIEKASTKNLTAYDFYQRGREEHIIYWINNNDKESLNEAEDFYKNSLKYDSTFALAISGLAQVYWDKNYWQEFFSRHFMDSVIVLANIALSYDDQLAEAYSLKGDYFTATGNYQHALEEYEKAININPNYWQAYYGEGYLYGWYLRDFVMSAEKLQMAEKLNHDKNLPSLLKFIGQGFELQGFPDKAKEYYDKALKLDRDSADYFYRMAGMECSRENYQKSIDLSRKCLSFKTDRNYYLQIGHCFMYLGKKDSATIYYKKFINTPEVTGELNLQATHRIGYAYWICGDSKEVEYYFNLQKKYCEESIKLNRVYAQGGFAYYDLAAVYAFTGDKKKAYEYLQLYNTKIGENESYIMIWYLKTDPLLKSIRNEPQFQEIYNELELKYKKTSEALKNYLQERGEL
ncbi:MAG: hypothetical protein A2Y71_14955 [Bacteroidetes bacterium RBG_13_42_15]|nr:MAG: hypothetical protein A2Y71_14955 [Bacteroidetes bacterium RBG_13_42_15]